jgi:hypothetical protein
MGNRQLHTEDEDLILLELIRALLCNRTFIAFLWPKQIALGREQE